MRKHPAPDTRTRSSTSSSSSARTAASITCSPPTCRRTGEQCRQPAVQRHHQARRQQERRSGTQLRQGAPARRRGSGSPMLPAEPAEDRLSRTISCPRRWSAARTDSYFPNQCDSHADHALRGDCAGGAVGERPAEATTINISCSGGTGQTSKMPDTAHHQRERLAGRPFQLTNGSTLHLRRLRRQPGAPLLPDVAAARLQHSRTRAASNPSGCNADLFSWVEVTVGAGTNGAAQPANFSTEYSPTGDDHR